MTCSLANLLERIQGRQAVVGIIGLGYVGLPLALLFEESGFPVIGFDVDPEKPKTLLRGESYIRHLGAERVAAARGARALTRMSGSMAHSETYFRPTPST